MKEIFDPPSKKDKEARKVFEDLSEGKQQEARDAAHEHALRENKDSFYSKQAGMEEGEQKEAAGLTLKIVEAIDQKGGLALIVGGYARDEALARLGYDVEPKDIDIEVYGVEFEDLMKTLESLGRIDIVGASFNVIKIGGIDVSIPRKDSKAGPRHTDFVIQGDPYMEIRGAARRRDFTINALALNPLTGEMIDPFGGLDDMEKKVLRATDLKLFGDDPLRVLRAMQFAGRFGFSIDEKTAELCRSLELKHLSQERIGEEWVKLMLRSKTPGIGLEAAKQLGVLEKLHPELDALIGVPQESAWHPEGDVWEHTKLVVNEAAKIIRREGIDKTDEKKALVVMFGALCHDLGKPATTQTNEKGRIISYGHDEEGVAPAKQFLEFIKIPPVITDRVLPIISEHLFPALNAKAGASAVRRLSVRLSPVSIDELLLVAEADHRGRTLPWDGFPGAVHLRKEAKKWQVISEAPKSILRGRDLIEMGLTPGILFGKILRPVYEAQLSGEVKNIEDARALARKLLDEMEQ